MSPKRQSGGADRFRWRLAQRILGAALADEVLGDLVEQRALHSGAIDRSSDGLGWSALWLALSIRFRRSLELRKRGSSHVKSSALGHEYETPAGLRSRLQSALGSIRQDVSLTFRSMRRTPAMAVAVLLTLTIGLGATTAMFSVVRGVLLRPLPFAEPEALVRMGAAAATAGQIDELRSLRTVKSVTALGRDSMVLEVEGSAVELQGLLVDGYHHRVLGVPPLLGRGFEPGDAVPGADPVVVLGHETWVRHFDSDPEIVGRVVPLRGLGASARTVIGVQTENYRPTPWDSGFAVPHTYSKGTHEWDDMARFWAVARVATDTSRDAVTLEAQTLIGELAARGRAFDRQAADDFQVAGLLDAQVGRLRQRLWLLFAVVGLVLLIGCANIANLVLVHGMARMREFELRKALGAGKVRLARQMVTEGIVLSVAGGLLGVALAGLLLPVILKALPSALPRADEIHLDLGVLTFSMVVSMVVGLLFGLIPLLRIFGGMKESGLGARGEAQNLASRRLNDVLVAGQIAMSLVLLTSCGLLLRSLAELHQVDPGFEVEHLQSFRMSPPADRYPEAKRVAYFEQLEQALAAVPGVDSVGSISNLPLTPNVLGVGISPSGEAIPDSERPLMVSYRAISSGYMSAARVPLLRGRDLTPADRLGAEPVGLVNQRLAERLWPDDDPVGRQVVWNTGEAWFRVVGVVGDVRQVNLATATKEEAYIPYSQESWVQGMHLLVRSRGGVASTLLLRDALQGVDPMVPISGEATMVEVMDESLAIPTFNAYFFASFALLGLVLSAIGVYGVTLYVVSQRTRELGVRMALGADGRTLVREVVRGNLPAVCAGLVLGLGGAWFSGRVLGSLLFSVGADDPSVAVVSIVALGGGSLVVSLLAARRVARLDPSSVLGAD